MGFLCVLIIIIGLIGGIRGALQQDKEVAEMKKRIEEQQRKNWEEHVAYQKERERRAKARQQATQQASKVSTNATHSSFNPSINYSSQSSNIGYNNVYPVKKNKTVEETMRECDEYWERYLGMPISSITNTPDYSSFGVAANTPGIDLAEAQMFDDLDLI